MNPLLALIEIALNRVLALDAEALDRFALMQGKVIGIELKGLGLIFYLLPGVDGVRVASSADTEADVFIRGAPLSLLRASMQDKRGLFAGDVTLDGDIDLGQKVQKILAQLEIDWEEGLSHVMGDVLAHQAGQAIKGALDWLKGATSELEQDAAEYLKEEQRDVPSPVEVEIFLKGVDGLRADTDRLAARIRNLEDQSEQGRGE